VAKTGLKVFIPEPRYQSLRMTAQGRNHDDISFFSQGRVNEIFLGIVDAQGVNVKAGIPQGMF